jgi:4-amino-4-deoxychorismate lyase
MCQLFESIRCFDGSPENLDLHLSRMKKSSLAVFGVECDFSFKLSPPSLGLFKCRVFYDTEVRNIQYEEYSVQKIETLKLVFDDTLEYRFKFADRSRLNELYQSRGAADDILIVKQERVTDTSYGNIVFFDGEAWVTPSKPLLNGIYREKLLNDGLIVKQDIKVRDLGRFSRFSVINSMRRFDYTSPLEILPA